MSTKKEKEDPHLIDLGQMMIEEPIKKERERMQTDHTDLDELFHQSLRKVMILETAPKDKRIRIGKLIDRLRACKNAIQHPTWVYGQYLDLKRRVALCPFHDERTPSFNIFNDGGFYCFGCNEHGDVFDFVQKVHKCSLAEAVSIVEGFL